MRKADLINKVSERTGVSKVDVLVTVEQALLTIQHTLAAGQRERRFPRYARSGVVESHHQFLLTMPVEV